MKNKIEQRVKDLEAVKNLVDNGTINLTKLQTIKIIRELEILKNLLENEK